MCFNAMIILFACEGTSNRQDENTTLDADTTAIDGNLTSRGLPIETIPDQSPLSGDTIINNSPVDKDHIPTVIQERIKADTHLRDKKITEINTYTLKEQTMYELTFEGDETKIHFDENGNRVIRD